MHLVLSVCPSANGQAAGLSIMGAKPKAKSKNEEIRIVGVRLGLCITDDRIKSERG